MVTTLTLFIALLVAALAWLIARSIIIPIQNVSRTVHRIRNENDFTLKLEVKGRNELADMAVDLNRLVESFRNVVIEINRSVNMLNEASTELAQSAEQTNLLALNAAIEAARAGEQGRGFAVVADEVRNLAIRTQQSTEEITTIVGNLQRRTQSIVHLVDSSHGKGQEAAERASTVGDLLSSIIGDLNSIMEMATQVATAIEEQSSAAAEVGKNVVQIRDLAEQVNVASIHNKQASEMVAEQAANLKTSVNRFRV